MDKYEGRTPREAAAEIAQELIDETKFHIQVREANSTSSKEYTVGFKDFCKYLRDVFLNGFTEALVETGAGVINPNMKIKRLMDILDHMADPEKELNWQDEARLDVGLATLEKMKQFLNRESLKWRKYHDEMTQGDLPLDEINRQALSIRQADIVTAGIWEIETKLYDIMERLGIKPTNDLPRTR